MPSVQEELGGYKSLEERGYEKLLMAEAPRLTLDILSHWIAYFFLFLSVHLGLDGG